MKTLKVRNEYNKNSQNYSREAISFSDLVLSTICFRKKKICFKKDAPRQ